MRSFCDISYSDLNHPLQKLDVYLPDTGDSFPVFIYFHGGGFERGDKAARKPCFEHLTNVGIAVVSANYRLYPEAKYPEFIEDSAEVVAWVKQNIDKYCRMQSLYVGGSSAGAHLSMVLCFDERWLGKYGIRPMDIQGFFHDAGQPTCHFNMLKERGIDPRRIMVDETAPMFYVGMAEEYPPMKFIVSDDDMKNRYEETMLMISALRTYGHTEPEVSLQVMHGKHCAYGRMVDWDGKNVLGKLIAEFVLNWELKRK